MAARAVEQDGSPKNMFLMFIGQVMTGVFTGQEISFKDLFHWRSTQLIQQPRLGREKPQHVNQNVLATMWAKETLQTVHNNGDTMN